LQENVSAARGVAYQLRRVTELTAPQLAESLGFMGLTDPRYAAHAKVQTSDVLRGRARF